jgi:CRP-like cAMP-binding protein
VSIPSEFWAESPFDTLDADERAEFDAACETRAFAPGDLVYEAEKHSKGMYVLTSGSLALLDKAMATLSATGEVVVDEPGAAFSRGSLLETFPHRHECVAKSASEVAFLSREAFMTAFDANQAFALRLVDYIVQRGSDDVRALNQAIHGLLSES